MTTVNNDIDTLVPESTQLTLTTGSAIKVVRLKTRQLMKLLKILTRGAGSVLSEFQFSADMDPKEFTGTLIGAVILSIPEAEDETIDFIQTMVEADGLIVDPKSKPEREVNFELEKALRAELDNPELEDLIIIVEQIINNEAPHILALGKRLGLLLKAQKQTATPKPAASSVKSSKS